MEPPNSEELEMMEQAREVHQLRQDARATFGTEPGKRFLAYLKQQNYFLYSTFKPGDPHETSVREGNRQVIIDILAMMEPVDFDAILEQVRDEIANRDPLVQILGVPQVKG